MEAETGLNRVVDEQTVCVKAPGVRIVLDLQFLVNEPSADFVQSAEGTRSARSALHPHDEGVSRCALVTAVLPEEQVVYVLS